MRIEAGTQTKHPKTTSSIYQLAVIVIRKHPKNNVSLEEEFFFFFKKKSY
jgi:hypothetical protein